MNPSYLNWLISILIDMLTGLLACLNPSPPMACANGGMMHPQAFLAWHKFQNARREYLYWRGVQRND